MTTKSAKGPKLGPSRKLRSLEQKEQILQIEKSLAIEEGLRSNDPEEIMKANLELEKIRTKSNEERKSYIVDPYEFQSNFGYKDRRASISYSMLRQMAKTPIINAVIRTRINQVAAFAEPQSNEYSVGYIIRKKVKPGDNKNTKPTKEEEKKIFEITQFIENCGANDKWGGDDFDSFVRKVTRDSLTYDQMTFEVVPDKKGRPVEFYSVDAATCRVAEDYESYNLEENRQLNNDRMPPKVDGYYPSHVQIYNSKTVAEFYPWELCFGIRNPNTSIFNHGYGISELEELISVVTGLLWGEEYNRNFFKQGSAPKGILKVSGNFGDARLAEFRQQWNATIRGVSNSWKTPVLESDKVDWIDLQRTNRDMEFTNWIEFLIKICCAVYAIDPSEVNFPLQGGANSQPMFEGNKEDRVKQSKDKGLYPMLKFLQKRINKWIVQRLAPEYEFVFVGADSMSKREQAEYDNMLLGSRKTFNELRAQYGDEPVEGGDIIGNPMLLQMKQMAQQEEMMGAGMGGAEEGMEGEEGAEEGAEGGQEEPPMDENDQQLEQLLGEQEGVQKSKDSNPFVVQLNKYLSNM